MNTTTVFHYFDRICVINLPERRDRREQVARELAAIGLPIDGDRVRFVQGIRPDDAGSFPSVGARGCYMSHLNALRQAKEDGVKNVLILEDDVMLNRTVLESGSLLPTLSGQAWHLAYPGHVESARRGPLRWVPTSRPLVCAHCYAVNSSALPRVIDYLESCMRRQPGDPKGGPMHFDGALTMLRQQQPGLTTIIASRALATQRSSRSDIAGPSWIDKLPFAEFATLARGARNWLRRMVHG